jgi:hypothetical protein
MPKAGMSQVLEEAGDDNAKDLEPVIPDLAGHEESLDGFNRIMESRGCHSETDHTVGNIFDRCLDI